MTEAKPNVFFASAVPERMDRNATLPAKFMRLLERLPIREAVKGKPVAVKMHVGGGLGYSTVHPLFVKLLCDHLKQGEPGKLQVMDGSVNDASDRGYAEQTIGADVVSLLGEDGKDVVSKQTGWSNLETAWVGKAIVDAEVLINLSHVKGHGCCGFGGACKNLAMGCVSPVTRGGMHGLEGRLAWSQETCTHCRKCIDECEMNANTFTSSGEYRIDWHQCKRCMHCMLACPSGAIDIENRNFDLFQEGLARVAQTVMNTFTPDNVFHINVLSDITLWCDCWGLTTPDLVPDIGIMASRDIVAIDHASLDAIKVENLIPGSLTPPYQLGEGNHLFEKLHGKDPFSQVVALERLGAGSSTYQITEVP